MISALCAMTTDDLNQLAGAIRAGRLVPPFTALALRRYVTEGMAGRIADELQHRTTAGSEPRHLADCLEILGMDRSQRPVAEDMIDLVWTGPEAPGIVNRDTSVVVRELFQSARESVLVAGYAVYQGHVIFKELAERMDQSPNLRVTMYLDVQRPHHDQSSPSELVRAFAERFVSTQWPGRRFPEVYYDPRSLDADLGKRTSLHAKCVVVDQETAFVSSANFTEAAQKRNIEVGLLSRNKAIAISLSYHFESLAVHGILRRVPLGFA